LGDERIRNCDILVHGNRAYEASHHLVSVEATLLTISHVLAFAVYKAGYELLYVSQSLT
jgi:hypothetical protein